MVRTFSLNFRLPIYIFQSLTIWLCFCWICGFAISTQLWLIPWRRIYRSDKKEPRRYIYLHFSVNIPLGIQHEVVKSGFEIPVDIPNTLWTRRFLVLNCICFPRTWYLHLFHKFYNIRNIQKGCICHTTVKYLREKPFFIHMKLTYDLLALTKIVWLSHKSFTTRHIWLPRSDRHGWFAPLSTKERWCFPLNSELSVIVVICVLLLR